MKYYDLKVLIDVLRWYRVDVKFVEKFNIVLLLKIIKFLLEVMEVGLVKKGYRLLIMFVEENEWYVFYCVVI